MTTRSPRRPDPSAREKLAVAAALGLQFCYGKSCRSLAHGSGQLGAQVANVIESTGNIETVCLTSAPKMGDPVKLIFRALEDSDPPYTVRITSPGAKVVLERVLRELPDGKPQSAPPITFNALIAGEYKIDIWQLYGQARGAATLNVADVNDPG